MPLTDRDRAILDLERTWWSRAGSKAAAIQSQIGVSPTWYYRLRAELMSSAEAEAYDPLVVRRLRRSQRNRRRARIEGGRMAQPPGR
jgi:hypothetical protein